MFTPTRFPGGITNVGVTSGTAALGMPDPSAFHSYFNDFDTFAAGDWTITEIGAGGTSALGAGDGGWLVLTTDALDNDAIQIQTTVATFLMEAGKQAFFKARLKIEDATQSDMLIGLVLTDTTAFDNTDGIFFQKDDGDTNLDFYCQLDTTTGRSSQAAVGTIADDTFITLGWRYDGVDTAYAYIDDVLVAKISATSTYLPNAALAVTAAYRAGEAGAIAMTIDYLFAAKER